MFILKRKYQVLFILFTPYWGLSLTAFYHNQFTWGWDSKGWQSQDCITNIERRYNLGYCTLIFYAPYFSCIILPRYFFYILNKKVYEFYGNIKPELNVRNK